MLSLRLLSLSSQRSTNFTDQALDSYIILSLSASAVAERFPNES